MATKSPGNLKASVISRMFKCGPSQALPDDKIKRDEAGIVGYMQKPISVKRIQQLIGLG